LIEGTPIPISCPKCGGEMIIISYDPMWKVLKERSWQICRKCSFERSADDFKKELLTV